MGEKWTPQMVAARMEDAASTLKRLPSDRPKGYTSSWPPIIREFMEAYGWSDAEIRLGPPTSDAITRMDEALSWLRWLEPEQVRLVWLHAERVPRKLIMAKLGVSRATAWRLWAAAMVVITTRLNLMAGKDVETRC